MPKTVKKIDTEGRLDPIGKPVKPSVRSSLRVAQMKQKEAIEEKKRNKKIKIQEELGKFNAFSKILEEEGITRKYPFPQTWESNLEVNYKHLTDDMGKYDLIKNKFQVFNDGDWSWCDKFFTSTAEAADNSKIGQSLKVSMFFYLTIFNIQYKDTHTQKILHGENRKDLTLLLSILECFIKNLLVGVIVNQHTGELQWAEGTIHLDIDTLKKAIESANVSQEVVSQEVIVAFVNLLELTNIFFGAEALQVQGGGWIEAPLIFQHPMKDSPELTILLFDILKNKPFHEQAQVHPGKYVSTMEGTPLSVHFIFSLIYSPIFRLTVLFSKYLKTGTFDFLMTAIPVQIRKINELYNLLEEINNFIETEGNREGAQLKIQIKDLLNNFIEIRNKSPSSPHGPDGTTMHAFSDWILSLDKLRKTGAFQEYVKKLYQKVQGAQSAGGKKNKELEKEIKKISRNALKILKKKELIKEKIKKIDNKLKELDNKKKELGKIYKTKKNKVLKDKIDKTIKNINKEKINKSEKKKELKNTSNEYKKIDKELKKMDKVLKKLKIKNKKAKK